MLQPGDIIEITYRAWRRIADDEVLVNIKVRGEIIDCEPGTWPLARLADGQVTEVRPFMTWRTVSSRQGRRLAA